METDRQCLKPGVFYLDAEAGQRSGVREDGTLYDFLLLNLEG